MSMTYYPKINGQVELVNREINRILKKMVNPSIKDWSSRLTDALLVYRTTYKTNLRASPYRFVYGKACHLPVELEHRAFWAIKKMNFDSSLSGTKLKLQIFELEEIRNDCTRIQKYSKHVPKLLMINTLFASTSN